MSCEARCCNYILLTPCAGQTSPPDVYVHQKHLRPDSGIVNVDGVCYHVPNESTTAPRVRLPFGALSITLDQVVAFIADCTECLADPENDPRKIYPRKGRTILPPPFTAVYALATVCSGYAATPRVWVAINHLPYNDDEVYFVADGRCWRIKRSGYDPEDEPLAGDVYASLGTRFEACDECADGVQWVKCSGQEGQPGFSAAPDIWTELHRLPSEGVFVEHFGICYHLDISATPGVIPTTAKRLRPTETTYESCVTCMRGIEAVLCPSQFNADKAPRVWVETKDMPAELTIFRASGWCYSIDPAGTEVRIPANGRRAKPDLTYADCDTCVCGPPNEVDAVKVDVCPGQPLINVSVNDYWVKDTVADNYNTPRTWAVVDVLGRAVCYHFNPKKARQRVAAKDVTFIDPPNQYGNCNECISANSDDTDEDPPQDPPDDDTPETGSFYLQLATCPNSDPANLWVAVGTPNFAPGQVVKSSGGNCFVVLDQPEPDSPNKLKVLDPGSWTTYADCETCKPICKSTWEAAWDCGTESWGAPYLVTSACPGDCIGLAGWHFDRYDSGAEQIIYQMTGCRPMPPLEDCTGCPDVTYVEYYYGPLPAGTPPQAATYCGNKLCKSTWEAAWDCGTETWGAPYLVTSECPASGVNGVVESWGFDRCESGSVIYRTVVNSTVTSGNCTGGGCPSVVYADVASLQPLPREGGNPPTGTQQTQCCAIRELTPCSGDGGTYGITGDIGSIADVGDAVKIGDVCYTVESNTIANADTIFDVSDVESVVGNGTPEENCAECDGGCIECIDQGDCTPDPNFIVQIANIGATSCNGIQSEVCLVSSTEMKCVIGLADEEFPCVRLEYDGSAWHMYATIGSGSCTPGFYHFTQATASADPLGTYLIDGSASNGQATLTNAF